MHRRIAAVGLGALAVLSLALSACSSSSTSASSSTTPSATPAVTASVDPAAAMTSAVVGLSGQGYDMTLSAASATGKGSVDPAKNAVTFETTADVQGATFKLDLTQIGSDLWVKVDLGAAGSQLGLNPAKWMKVDTSKVDDSTLGIDLQHMSDALDLETMSKAVSDVKRTDATHLTGTIDLTKLTGAVSPDSGDLNKAGAAAKSVPFTMTLDNQGRPVELKIDGDSVGTGLSVDIGISNIGSPGPITAPPASDVVPAPAGIYQVLGKG